MTYELTTDPPEVAIDDTLFTSIGPEGRLLGSRCASCGHIAFPSQDACPGCGNSAVASYALSRIGTLWTWTIQNFRPKPPFALPPDDDFEPYGVGYVELPGELRVESRLTIADPDRLRIGMPMELTFIPLWVADGQKIFTYAFAPIEKEQPV